MAAPDFEFIEGFDKYGPPGETNWATHITQGDWTSVLSTSECFLTTALSGTGAALFFRRNSVPISTYRLFKTLPANYARTLGGFCFSLSQVNSGVVGIEFFDGASQQVGIRINVTTNTISVTRGAIIGGTVLGTSVESVAVSTVHYLEYDITFHNTTGIVKIWLDGVLTSINLTGQNTRATANNFFNGITGIVIENSGSTALTVDHFYVWSYTASGGTETPALTNPIVETQVPSADSAVAWTPTAGVLGTAFQTTGNVSSPAANSLVS
jgi:hypothetical protein